MSKYLSSYKLKKQIIFLNFISPAFTLAEVLITLGIIGVVAAMTIPTLLTNFQKKDTFVALQKALSVISEASALIRTENGGSMRGLATSHLEFENLFKQHMKVATFCQDATDSENCYIKNADVLYNLQGGIYGNYNPYGYSANPKIVTGDGFVYTFSLTDSDCAGDKYVRGGIQEFCGTVTVDINGIKKPNTYGKDIFLISVNKYNTTPYADMTVTNATTVRCDPSTVAIWQGSSCAMRAIMDGEINYY